MTCLNKVLSITVAKCDSLINRVSFARDFHYFKIKGAGRGREGVDEESRLSGKGWVRLVAVELCCT